MKNKYIIVCPKCKSTHDVSEQMNIWKQELYEKIDKFVKEELENQKT